MFIKTMRKLSKEKTSGIKGKRITLIPVKTVTDDVDTDYNPTIKKRRIHYHGVHADQHMMNSSDSYSPYSMDSPHTMEAVSPGSFTGSLSQTENILHDLQNAEYQDLGSPQLQIVIQPVDKFRFRYKSEMMGTHGSLLGEKADRSTRKEVPTVKLFNAPLMTKAIIRCTLVTSDEERRMPHAHHLVMRHGNDDEDDPHEIEVSEENNYTAAFCGMGIIHTAKKNIKDELVRKRKREVIEEKVRQKKGSTLTVREESEIKMEVEAAQKWMNLNSVALCFQAFAFDNNSILNPITKPIYSHPINNLKSALTGELKICRIDKNTSSCEGSEEIWILVEKVGKKNIKIKIYEVDDYGNETWSDYGRFSELDVHHQYAIVFRTPPYKDRNITSPKEVFIKLERPTDGECSNSMRFTYKESNKTLSRKRARVTPSSGNSDFSQVSSTMQVMEPVSVNDTFMNISEELSHLLNSGPTPPSDEFRQYVNDIDEEYMKLLMNDVRPEYQLVADSTDTDNTHQFARENVLKALDIVKDGNNSAEAKKQVLMLLRESTVYSDTPLHYALRHDQIKIAKSILQLIASDLATYKPILDLQNCSFKTPLHYAAMKNQPEVVEVLLKLGADPNIWDESNYSPLHDAIQESTSGLCVDALLLSPGIKVELDAISETGWSALHLAAKVGSLHSVRSLVNAGADVNIGEDSYGRTALHIAVEGGHKDIVAYLLTHTKIDVNKKNYGGNTALHGAVVRGGTLAKELCELLTKHGADPTIQNDNNSDEDDVDSSAESSNLNSPAVPLEKDNEIEQLVIKIEKDDDQEEPRMGKTSFDLAADNVELLTLLESKKSAEKKSAEKKSLTEQMEELTVDKIKQEVEEESELSEEGERELEDEELDKIVKILNLNNGWEELAEKTGNGFTIRSLKKCSNPTLPLINKIKLKENGLTVNRMIELLESLDETEALSVLTKKRR